jgi:hypothetical protein
MSRFIDLTGKRFGRLVVIHRAQSSRPTETKWECLCDCGNKTIVDSFKLRNGITKSCGCLAKELTSSRSKKHGMFGTRLYRIWFNMKQRCSNPKHIAFKNYGGRGIEVCSEWLEFETFCKWAMSYGYCEDLSIDRIDNDKGYSPENCRWSTEKEQGQNKRNNRVIHINGESHTIAEWARYSGIKENTLRWRITNGVPIEELLKSHIRGGVSCQ